MIVAATALRPLIRKAWEATTFTSRASASGSNRRGPGKPFKGGSGGTADSTKELKPLQQLQSHQSTSAGETQHQHQQPSPLSIWPNRQVVVSSTAADAGRNNNSQDSGYFDGISIPLSPMTPHSQNAILKTERFSVSSSGGDPNNQPPTSPMGMMDLEAGGGGIWDGRSRLLV